MSNPAAMKATINQVIFSLATITWGVVPVYLYATGLIANGVDIAYVAQLLGHESLETTKRYLKIEISDLKNMHARFHPRETAPSSSTDQE